MARMEESRISGSGHGKVMYVPPMEPWGARFFAAVFRSIGYDARPLVANAATLALGMKHTGGGECVPCPSTTGALLAAVEKDGVDPSKVVFFMPTACGPCRFGQYCKLDRMIFAKKGWEGIQIMSPSAENAYEGIDTGSRILLYHALIVADIMRKLTHRVRPYEFDKGTVDNIVEHYTKRLEEAFAAADKRRIELEVAAATRELAVLARAKSPRPLVGVVGEIYVRCDPFLNDDLCRRIEELGGEAWLAPLSEWVLYTNYLRTLIVKEREKGVVSAIKRARIWLETKLFFEKVEKLYYDLAKEVLGDRHEHPIEEVMEEGMGYFPWQFEGEAVLTVGRAALFVKKDGAKAIVNASPMFCMPGTITSSVFPDLEKKLGVPIVCNFYDGSGNPNQSLVPVMHYLAEPYRESQMEEMRQHHDTDINTRMLKRGRTIMRRKKTSAIIAR